MRNRRCATGMFVALVALASARGDDELFKKAPPPTGAVLTAASKRVADVFRNDVTAAKTPEAKQALARQYLQAGTDEKDVAIRYVLLESAENLAAQMGDLTTALAAVDACESTVEIDALKLKTELAGLVIKAKLSAADAKAAYDTLTSLTRTALRAYRFDLAVALAGDGIQLAHILNDPAVLREASLAVQNIREAEAAYPVAKAAMATLAGKPEEPEANGKLGKFLCLNLAEWEGGLKHLALSADAALKGLAAKELAGVGEAEEQVRLGDGWWEVATPLTGCAKTHVLEHAGKWYSESLATLDKGLTRIRVEKRLAELAPSPPPPSSSATEPAPTVPAANGWYLGEWRAGASGGGKMTIAIYADGKALKSDSVSGKWTLVNGEVHIVWADKWTCILRRQGNGVQKLSFTPGNAFTGVPDNASPAIKR